MNLPPRVHPTGVDYNVGPDQVRRSLQIEATRQGLREGQRLAQGQAAAGEVAQAQLAMSSQPELAASQLLNQVKGGLQAMTLQLDPQSLDGTRAMAAMTQRLGSADPGVIARAIGMA